MNTFPIRPGMDVFGAHQNEYIGTVTEVWHGAVINAAVRPSSGERASQAELHTPGLQHEQGGTVSPTETIGNREGGEEMGPFPTIAVGNTGPVQQSASHAYATAGAFPSVLYFAVRPGRLNFGPFTPVLYIPADAICSISQERIVLDRRKRDIPEGWSVSPGSRRAQGAP